ncbi:diphthamide biosynthesis 2 [Homo sapiens]|uniref:Diphthamide biosynthesis 2 n=1 Tax=Homo sapiens TaxID=9606 RepID=E9PPU3_HUMAN|nr:diphthamide biosynthesis 2 [Homo sapiens]KAI4080283.1 diphthamide biosynthesis 2 [Homo sapiens]
MESMFSSPAEAALQRETGVPGLLTPLPDLDGVLPCSSLTSYWEMLWLWLHDWRRRQGQRCSFWVTQPTAGVNLALGGPGLGIRGSWGFTSMTVIAFNGGVSP